MGWLASMSPGLSGRGTHNMCFTIPLPHPSCPLQCPYCREPIKSVIRAKIV